MRTRLLASVLATVFFAGCAGMGGGDRSTPGGQRTVGEVVDDVTIGTQLKAKYAADPDISALKINIDTTQGAVRLKGEVKSLALRRKAEQLARDGQGSEVGRQPARHRSLRSRARQRSR
jgi:hypothetical protein